MVEMESTRIRKDVKKDLKEIVDMLDKDYKITTTYSDAIAHLIRFWKQNRAIGKNGHDQPGSQGIGC